jgi:uncharacterized protein YbjT (DUF2867 family)
MILVTGAAGISGTAVIRELTRNGASARALVRDRARAMALEGLPGIEVIEGDMQRPETLGQALAGVERALMISTANPAMVDVQCAFIDACKKAGVRFVIKFSGKESGVGFDARKFRYGAMHEDIELHLERSGLAWAHLRPSQFMHVYLREASTISAQGALRLPFEDIALAPVDVEDVAKAAHALLVGTGYESQAFEMTGPEALTMAEIAERISAAVGKAVRYVNITLEERRAALLSAGTPPQFVDDLIDQAVERRKRPVSDIRLETHSRFGIRPTTFGEFAIRNSQAFGGLKRA